MAMRKKTIIYEAVDEMFNRVWLHRHYMRHYEGSLNDEGSVKAYQEAIGGEEKYGKYQGHTDFELGMLNGKLSALRWVVGEEWDFLDC